MGRFKLCFQQPKLRLQDLLRKRKRTFEDWLTESGVSTYVELKRWCARVGVGPPSEDEWHKLKPVQVSSPPDGVVVLEPPPEAPKRVVRKKKDDPFSDFS